MGQLAHVGGRVAHSQARSSPTLASVVFDSLLPDFHDFGDQISFVVVVCLPPHLFPIFLYAQHVETNTYPKK